MSVENRKRMYDELVAKGRYADIDSGLIAEFGDPAPKKAVEPPVKELLKEKAPAPVTRQEPKKKKGGKR